jgi:hypothetical protein
VKRRRVGEPGAASVFEARSQGDKETKPTPNLGVGHWYRQSTFPGTLGNYLYAEVRRVESVENEVENWRMGPLTSSLWISLAVQSSSGEPPSELTD